MTTKSAYKSIISEKRLRNMTNFHDSGYYSLLDDDLKKKLSNNSQLNSIFLNDNGSKKYYIPAINVKDLKTWVDNGLLITLLGEIAIKSGLNKDQMNKMMKTISQQSWNPFNNKKHFSEMKDIILDLDNSIHTLLFDYDPNNNYFF